jgi:hypothetical protein
MDLSRRFDRRWKSTRVRHEARVTACEAAEKMIASARKIPQALKRGHISNDSTARVELVPFPKPFELEFFRSLFDLFEGNIDIRISEE